MIDQQARTRLAVRRDAERRRRRRTRALRVLVVIIVAVAVLVAAAFLFAQAARNRANVGPDPAGDPYGVRITGEQVYPDQQGGHVDGAVAYPATPVPPVGGKHDRVWQNADGAVYDRPLRNEHAVHSLEHGAVWVTYGDATAEEIAAFRAKVAGVPYRMMSPLPGQPVAFRLTAWGHQLSVDSAADPRVDQFFDAYVQGPQAPEPGAPVTGGRAEP
jgi:hypothetical protein